LKRDIVNWCIEEHDCVPTELELKTHLPKFKKLDEIAERDFLDEEQIELNAIEHVRA
jgi:hypothetical protein